MGYPYRFIDLNEAQLAQRRRLLDGSAQVAQSSIIIFPLIFYVTRWLVRWLHQTISVEIGKDRQSPIASRFEIDPKGKASLIWARIRWAMDDEVVDGWGTWMQWIFGLFWGSWLLFVAVRTSGDGELISSSSRA